MSELIEINEGNCVLDSFELSLIKLALDEYAENFTLMLKKLNNAYLKINKLNEMAKHEMLMDEGRKNDTDMATLLS